MHHDGQRVDTNENDGNPVADDAHNKLSHDNSSVSSNKRKHSIVSGTAGAQNEGEYWKGQYEELQREQKDAEVNRKVLEVKNQRLEEKCTRLESQLQTALELSN